MGRKPAVGVELICLAPGCGMIFTDRPNKMYCSKRCKDRIDKQRWRAKRKAALAAVQD